MFKFLKKENKCPTCQMRVTDNAISKYGEKFCSSGCAKEYEKKNQITDSKHPE